MAGENSLDPVWDEKYAAGHEQRYPWDVVVSFVFRNAPRDRDRSSIRILEVGCGTGANLRFAAREGFTVAGIDGSCHAIARARRRFDEEGIEGDLRIGSFTELPFDDNSFDLVIDRAALTCCREKHLQSAVSEIGRVTKKRGRFLFNPYSDLHTSYDRGSRATGGVIENIQGGSLVDVGHIHFVSRSEIDQLFMDAWKFIMVQHVECVDALGGAGGIHAEWRVILERR